MKVTLSFLRHLCRCLGILLQLLRYALSFCWALLLPRGVTAAQLLAFQSQLAVELNRSCAPRKRHHKFSPAFRILWVVLSKFLDGWGELVHVMRPETVKRWHNRAFRAWWRRKSRAGRKPVALEVQQLIRRLSKENPLWGAERILEVLLMMGYEAHYHIARPHQGLAGEKPVCQAPPGEGELISVPVLGGLHHRYWRAAA